MKKLFGKTMAFVLVCVMIIGMLPGVVASAGAMAEPIIAEIRVDGEAVTFEAYSINDAIYYKLRDLAYALNGTNAQFEIYYEEATDTIYIEKGKPYSPVGGEMTGAGTKTAAYIEPHVLLDGGELQTGAYQIEGSNYFSLDELASILGLSLSYDNGAVSLTTDEEELQIVVTSDGERIYEAMDYRFIPDESVIGDWEAVDFIEKIEDFDPNQPNWEDFFYLSNSFYDNGEVIAGFQYGEVSFIWTKGYIFELGNGTIPAYEVKSIEGADYLFIQWKSGDYTYRGMTPWYYVFKKVSDTPIKRPVNQFDDVRWSNLNNMDLSSLDGDILSLWFNEASVWPDAEYIASLGLSQPDEVLEAGKNPGLGVRSLHEQGITGKGVNVAIIDQPMYYDSHPEYAGKIIEYKDFDCESESSMHGPGVTSLLVGENIGTAPGAKVYYAAVPSWKGDASYYADALDWIVETNEGLPEDGKIRLVSVSAAPSGNAMFINGDRWIESVKRAQEAGILIMDCTSEFGFIGPCSYDYDNPEDAESCTPGFLGMEWAAMPGYILAPVSYRTTAEEYEKGDHSYQYNGRGGLSWAIPYCAGVLAMGWELRPELTADEMVEILFETAYVDSDGNSYIYPDAFIEYLKNK